MFSGVVGLVQVLCLGGFVLTLVLSAIWPRSHRETPDEASHRRLMRELRHHE